MLCPAFGLQQAHAWGSVARKLPDGKGPGLLTYNQLNTCHQCAKVVKVANSILAYFRNNVVRRTRALIVPLYSAPARTQLKYSV